jgi:hypothetical protein
MKARKPIPDWPEYEVDSDGGIYRMAQACGAVAGNVQDTIRHGRMPRGESKGNNKYPEELMRSLRSRIESGEKVSALSAETGIPRPTLYGLASRQTWRWL